VLVAPQRLVKVVEDPREVVEGLAMDFEED
jgi:hypothetical protein